MQQLFDKTQKKNWKKEAYTSILLMLILGVLIMILSGLDNFQFNLIR